MLFGPNGAGKTSVLRACAGLLAISQGDAMVLGHDLRRHRTAVRRVVGMLGHEPALYDDLTVAENVRFGVRAAGADPGAVDPVIERLGLGGRVRRTPAARLSAGQRRRVALAGLIARAPRLWLLDEPHAALDSEARDLLDDALREATASGATALVASHEPDRVLPLADRVVDMAGGRVTGQQRGQRPRQLPGGAHVA